jgi:hypothetical protein
MVGGAIIMDEARTSNHPHHINNTSNASISFDLTIELTASGDENETNHPHAANNTNNNDNHNTAMTTTIVPKTITRNSRHQPNGKNKFKIVMPLISPDDGSVSVASAWDEEASASSVASKMSIASYSTNPARVRFQGITAYQHHHPPSAISALVAASAKGGAEDGSNVDKLQADIERQRSLRKRKEKALIKLAKELSKRTNEVCKKDQKIALQVDTIHQLEQQVLILSSNAAAASAAANHGPTNATTTTTATTTADDTTTHLRKELLRLQLSNDRLQAQLSHHHHHHSRSWPPALLAVVLVAILAWLLRSSFFLHTTTTM